MGLAYEIVINSNPCIAYLMEENTITMQALVIAHACYGHNSLLQGQLPVPHVDRRRRRSSTTWSSRATTSPSARSATACEAVEDVLDACHALMNHGVDRYQPAEQALARARSWRARNGARGPRAAQVNDLWRTLPRRAAEQGRAEARSASRAEPQENILYFIEKNAPLLEPWQREIVRIVRKIAQYFYPQRQTQVMNEGWATFWHYTLLNTLYDEGYLDRRLHDRVPEVAHQRRLPAAGRPPRATAASIRTRSASRCSRDIRRICEHPTDEDREWFPDLAGTRLAARRSTTRCATSRTRASSASTCRRS